MYNMAVALIPICIAIIITICIPVMVGVYVYRDAKKREMNAVLWALIAIIVPSLIGFIIYLLVRTNYSDLKCPKCNSTVLEQYIVCPNCGNKLKPTCPNCQIAVNPEWKVCPQCASDLSFVKQDFNTPTRIKDKGLWKILLAIILIPIIVIVFIIIINLSVIPCSGSCSIGEVGFDNYFNDEIISDDTKRYVKNWLDDINSNDVYALCYENSPDGRNKEYYYLIYVPNGGGAKDISLEQSPSLLSQKTEINLSGTENKEGLYSLMMSTDSVNPKIDVKVEDKKISTNIKMVDFNPT